jgi:hypothetical protein
MFGSEAAMVRGRRTEGERLKKVLGEKCASEEKCTLGEKCAQEGRKW